MAEPSPSTSRVAEEVFADFLRRCDAGEAPDLEALCHSHPKHGDELRALHAANRHVNRLLPARVDEEDDDAKAKLALRDLLDGLRTDAPRYRVLSEVGRGGMGVVHQAWDGRLRRTVAMKVTKEGDAGVPGHSRKLVRFLDEAQITGRLEHPGIVPVHEVGLGADGRVYFTMRLVRGVTLGTVFERVRSGIDGWTQFRALQLLLRACEAMSYAHAQGVIHRDLKPGNVMVGEFGEVYVMDWGLARVLSQPDTHDLRLPDPASGSLSRRANDREGSGDRTPDSPLVTMGGDVVGSPAYMPPEQANGQVARLGPHSDVYAVGAMLYELISGQMPYVPPDSRLSGQAVLARVIDGPPRPLHEFRCTASAELVAICEKAMARDIAARYPDMAALTGDLRALLENRVVPAYETGTWAETRKWVRRNRALAASLVAALVILAAGVSVSLILAIDGRRERLNTETWAHARAAAGNLDQFLELSCSWDHAWSLGATANDWWLMTARGMLAGNDPRTGLQVFRTLLANLRSHGWSTARSADEQAATWGPQAVDRARAQREWHARMLGKQTFPDLDTVEAGLRSESLPSDAPSLNGLAWAIVDPRRPRRGEEIRGLALARRAVAAAAGSDFQNACRDTLVWGLFHAARFEPARQEAAVVREARPKGFDSDPFYAPIDEFVEYWRSPAAETEYARLEAEARTIEEVARHWRSPLQELAALVRRLGDLRARVQIAEESIQSADARVRWAEAANAIRSNPRYRELVITPQLDLLPLGEDRRSGLWEFVHLPSGIAPARVDGELAPTPATGLVFVLLPGGSAHSHHGEVVDLDPFFISKYLVTVDQFRRLWSDWEGRPTVIGPMRPMGGITWNECAEVLLRAGSWLRMPSEQQLSHAWFGGGPESGRWWQECRLGATSRATQGGHRPYLNRVGTGIPNPFGLHDIEPGLSEWCQDTAEQLSPARPGDGLRTELNAWARRSLKASAAAESIEAEALPRTGGSQYHRLRPCRPLTR